MFLRSLTLIWLLTTTALCQAQDDNNKHLARFLNEQTLLVGKVDLQRVDIGATFDLLLGMKLPMHDAVQKGKTKLAAIHAALMQAGAERFYLVYNQEDLFQMPAVYVPLKDTTQAETVASLLAYFQPAPFPKGPSWLAPRSEAAWKVMDNYVVVGSAATLQTLANTKPAPRPQFQAALGALKDAPIQLILLPSADLRKVIAETMPKFPKELGEGSTASIVTGLQWANITAGLPPQLQAQVMVQTEKPSQAAEIEQLWQKMLAAIKKDADTALASTYYRVLYQLLDSMSHTQRDSRFILEANGDRITGITRLMSETLAENLTNDLNASNLRQIVIAMHNYHGDWNRLPNQAIMSKEGKPLLSWRVALLPYVGEDHLYKEFKLNEPWDSEHNKKLLSRMPKAYVHPFAKNVPADHTLYQVFYSKKGTKPAAAIMEEGKMTLQMLSVQDGTSNTFLVTDAAAEAVPWSKPADLLYDGTVANLPKLVSARGNEWAHVGFGDGSVRRFKPGGKPKLLWQLIGRNDGENNDVSEIFEKSN